MEKETDTDKILRAIVSVHEDIADIRATMATKEELTTGLAALSTRMDNGFTEVNRRIDNVIAPQLENHVQRIKKLEEEVFPR